MVTIRFTHPAAGYQFLRTQTVALQMLSIAIRKHRFTDSA
jgi:hypothetical protein